MRDSCSAIPSSRCCGTGTIWQALLLIAVAASFIVNMAFVVVVAHRSRHPADHAGGVRADASEMAHQRHPVLRGHRAGRSLAWISFASFAGDDRAVRAGLQILQRAESRRHRSDCGWNSMRKSLHFFAEAPVIGHGTGSTRGLFEAPRRGTAVLAQGQVIGNPHNQTLKCRGSVGRRRGRHSLRDVVVHLLLFRGEAWWPGSA